MTNRPLLRYLLIPVLALCSGQVMAEEGTDPFSNLVQVENPRVGVAFVDPEADFSVFSRIMILEPYVAFRSGWQRDVNRGTRRINVTTSDMERIRADVAALFLDVLSETLSENDGFPVVDYAEHDVLLLRPAIIDLDITAPDVRSAGRSRTYSASTGAATLYMELYDSVSGQILGRALDRQAARRTGGAISWSNRVTNTADARRVFRGWSEQLRAFLEEHYSAASKE